MTRAFLRRTAVFLLLLLASTAWAQVAAQKAAGAKPPKPAAPPAVWKQIPIPPLPPFRPQEPKRIQFANGMIIFLQEDHELPLVGGIMRIRGGSIWEPANKDGLVDVYGEVWRTGGTTQRTGDQLDDFLEARAAKVETGGSADSTSISFNCLKDKLDEVFPLFLELLRQPAFREDKIELAKTQLDTEIARRNDDVGDVAARESLRLAYGRDNPYASVPEYSTVAAITRDDLVKWHQTFVHPNNILLGIYGDFDSAAMERRLRQAFESWESAPVPPRPGIAFHDPKPGLYFIEKSDVNQSEIRMVNLGIERNNPDYFAVQVMNEVLGGGFSSRLFKSIRTEKGLAYSVGGGIGAAYDHPGVSRFGMGTKSPSTVDAIQALRSELQGMLTRPATEQEVREAKDAILNRFIFNFDSKDKVLAERMLYEFYGYPADFLERFRAGIEKTTPADVNAVAHKYLHPGQLATLVVGNQAEFGKSLSSLGPVTPIDITIPPPGASPGAAALPAQSDPKARALVEKFVSSIGGAARLDAVKSFHQKVLSTQHTPQGSLTFHSDMTVELPDKLRIAVTAPQLPGEMLVVVTPSAAFMGMTGAGVRDMPASMKQERLSALKRDWISIGQHAQDPHYIFSLAGNGKANNAGAQVVNISGDGVSLRWTLDPQSGTLLQVSYQDVGQRGPVQRVIDYSDWRPLDGLSLPFKRRISEDGQPSATDELQSFEVNPAVDQKLFEKPTEAAAPAK